jgi:hypothetical protein
MERIDGIIRIVQDFRFSLRLDEDSSRLEYYAVPTGK